MLFMDCYCTLFWSLFLPPFFICFYIPFAFIFVCSSLLLYVRVDGAITNEAFLLDVLGFSYTVILIAQHTQFQRNSV